MQLLEELKKGENKTLEFKEKLPDSYTLVKTIIAFSNTSGGKLIIGVNDKREVIGLKDIDIIEQWGSGIKRIKSSCIEHGLKEPLIQEKGDFVDVELYRLVSNNIGKVSGSIGKVSDNFNSDQEKEIIIFIEANEKITSKEVEALLKVKEARARRILKEMTEKTLLERKGSGRSTFYVLFNGIYR